MMKNWVWFLIASEAIILVRHWQHNSAMRCQRRSRDAASVCRPSLFLLLISTASPSRSLSSFTLRCVL